MIIGEIILFVLVLSFLVIIHELGHYLTAKWCKIKVEEFGVGYPPRAKKLFTHKGTLFSLNWIPFGGFVKMEGEDTPLPEMQQFLPEEKVSKTKKTSSKTPAVVSDDPKNAEGPFYTKSIPARLLVVVAGATVNLIFGFLAFSVFFSFKGIPVFKPQIEEVMNNTPAAKAQIPAHVQILSIEADGNVVKTPRIEDVTKQVSSHLGKTITVITTGPCQDLTCEPTEHEYQVYIRTKEETPEGEGSMGIRFAQAVDFQFYPWYEMPFRGAAFGSTQAFDLIRIIFDSLHQIFLTLVKGKVPQEVGSPIKIFEEGHKAGIFSQGPLILLNFAGIISINLAVFNLLPIPALDGGRAVLILLEKVVGKKRIALIEGYVNYGGLIFLMGLMLMIFAKDVIELIFRR
jgi:regulator of sigma E protease